MNAMNFSELIKSIIIASYEIIKALGIGAYKVLGNAAQSGVNITYYSSVFTYDLASEIIGMKDQLASVLLSRYVLTENNAISDANTIIAGLKVKYADLSTKVGIQTRSAAAIIAATKADLEAKIQTLDQSGQEKFAQAQDEATRVAGNVGLIKNRIFMAIDKGIMDNLDPSSAVATADMKGLFIQAGGRKRKSKRHTKKRSRSTRRSSRRSTRRSR